MMGWLSKIFGEEFPDFYCNNGALIGGCYYPVEGADFEIVDAAGEVAEGAVDMTPQMEQGGVTPNSQAAQGGPAPSAAGGKAALIGKTVTITTENPNYAQYKGKNLVITHVATSQAEHPGYDAAMGGQALVDLEVADTREEVPFSLYEHEYAVV
jgi:hypothetical protein